MRFKEGSKIEVFSKNDMPSGSWHCAEIINSNVQSYTVRYIGHKGDNAMSAIEIISERDIRPCPPPCKISSTRVPGDVVDLFDNFSWKTAIICEVLRNEYFSVRLLGSFLEFTVNRSNIRTRLSWQDNKWVIIGKDHDSLCKKPKRRKLYYKNQSMGENFVYSDDEVSCASSVGSCSIGGENSRNFRQNSEFSEDFNDANSYLGSYTKRELAAKIHMLELDAYRSTMEALYASGPLSWDKEAMVTNLRLSLNISNDEHLMEVRNLVSGDNSIPSR